jgi:hypothetical protein
LYRRLPNLLYRGFPNPQAVANPMRLKFPRPADLEIGDTADLEVCGTGSAVYATQVPAPTDYEDDALQKLSGRLLRRWRAALTPGARGFFATRAPRIVPQVAKPAVSRVSKPAGRLPIQCA